VVVALWAVRCLQLRPAWEVCTLKAWAVYRTRLPRPQELALERSWNGVPSLSNPVDVTLDVHNLSSTSVVCRVLEDVPKTLRSEPPEAEIKAPARDRGSASYTLLPLERGDNNLGAAYLRYQSAAQ